MILRSREIALFQYYNHGSSICLAILLLIVWKRLLRERSVRQYLDTSIWLLYWYWQWYLYSFVSICKCITTDGSFYCLLCFYYNQNQYYYFIYFIYSIYICNYLHMYYNVITLMSNIGFMINKYLILSYLIILSYHTCLWYPSIILSYNGRYTPMPPS